jgi:hypothetical protein
MRSLLSLGLAAVLVGLAVSGCGDTTEVVKTVTVERPAAPDRSPQPTRPEPGRSQRRAPSPAPTASAFIHCDPNIQVKESTTTCGFAENVFWHYWTSGESGSLQVWSPATQSTFATTCQSDGEQIVCTTSDYGVVTFPEAAVDRYSQTQADAYADSHDLGPDPYESLPFSDSSPSSPDSTPSPRASTAGSDRSSCDPNYKGECLDPDAVDYDCAGGSGDGPEYAGPVAVVGDDPHGLDADGDGFACELSD